MRTLSQYEARQYYDRFGRKQDLQAFYEGPAVEKLIAEGDFGQAESVFEFGCGTGRIAVDLLRDHLPQHAHYLGVDISSTMVHIAAARLRPLRGRGSVVIASAPFPVADGSADRVISTYVFDLLSEDAAREVIVESSRVLRPGGLLCIAGLTQGTTTVSRLVMKAWQWLFSKNPGLVGGCRPCSVRRLLNEPDWTIRSHCVVAAWGIASEIVIAMRTSGAFAA